MTVPLGALAEAYLDAMAGLQGDRMASLSAFVAVASQLILFKSRELLPRPPEPPVPLDDDADAEAALRARLIASRAFRDAAGRLAAPAAAGRQAVRRDPSIALATARAGAVEPLPPRLDPALLVAALDRLAAVAPAVALPPEAIPRTISLAERADLIRAALHRAPARSCSRSSWQGARPGSSWRSPSWPCSSWSSAARCSSSRTRRGVPSSCGRCRRAPGQPPAVAATTGSDEEEA